MVQTFDQRNKLQGYKLQVTRFYIGRNGAHQAETSSQRRNRNVNETELLETLL